MKQTVCYVKSKEEECGEEIFKVVAPEGTSKEEVFANFEKATAYASVCFPDNAYTEEELADMSEEERKELEPDLAIYDEHYQEMVEMADECGQLRFNYYLTEICGYTVEDFMCDYEYEW